MKNKPTLVQYSFVREERWRRVKVAAAYVLAAAIWLAVILAGMKLCGAI